MPITDNNPGTPGVPVRVSLVVLLVVSLLVPWMLRDAVQQRPPYVLLFQGVASWSKACHRCARSCWEWWHGWPSGGGSCWGKRGCPGRLWRVCPKGLNGRLIGSLFGRKTRCVSGHRATGMFMPGECGDGCFQTQQPCCVGCSEVFHLYVWVIGVGGGRTPLPEDAHDKPKKKDGKGCLLPHAHLFRH